MLKKSENLAKTGKLMVTIAAVAVDSTGLAATGAGLDAVLHVFDQRAGQNPNLKKLAAETQKTFTAELKNPRYDKPDQARTLLPQMLEQALPTGSDFVTHGLDPDPILAAMLARLTDPEHTRPEMQSAFRTLYGPLLSQVCNDPRLKSALDPALTRESMARSQRIEGKVDDLPERIAALLRDQGFAANPGDAVSRDDLRQVASRFGTPPGDTIPVLLEFLSDKASDMDRLSAEIETMRGLSSRIDNIASSAAAAIRHGKLDDARALLDSAREMQAEALRAPLEANAALLERTAEIDLIEGDVNAAYSHLSIAADSFTAIDQKAPEQRKWDLMLRHFHLGRSLGPSHLHVARMLVHGLRSQPEHTEFVHASLDQIETAICKELAHFVPQNQAVDLLLNAVTLAQRALTVFDKTRNPDEYAGTHTNMALALQHLGMNSCCQVRQSHFLQAIACYADVGIIAIMPMFGLCRVSAGDCLFGWVSCVFRLHKTAAETVGLPN